MSQAQRLIRLRRTVRAILILALAVSLAANVLHARGDLVSQIISAWAPLALMLTVELVSRIPADTRWLAVTRLIATATIAVIAAWVSYWHMVAVAAEYGEDAYGAQYLLPLTVDGLAVVASICLVEIGARLTALLAEPVVVSQPAVSLPADEPVRDEPEPGRELEPLDHVDPWRYSVPLSLVAEPVGADCEPVAQRDEPPAQEAQMSPGSGARRVELAHRAEPEATNQRIAELAGVSLATVKRHRPARTTNGSSRVA